MKITSVAQLYDILPKEEKLMVDVLRTFLIDILPDNCKEKISYNVPFFYGRRGICIIWPATIPRGGIKSGVLLGFWYGSKLKDSNNYLTHGTNKQIFYKIYQSVKEIHLNSLLPLVREAIRVDNSQ